MSGHGTALRRLALLCFILTSLVAFPFLLSAESVTVINRTGKVLDLIQAAPAGADRWGDDLIPGRIVEDGSSVLLDLIGDAPWSFRFLDVDGEVYVLYDIAPARTGKLSIGPEHLARISVIAGSVRDIQLTNRTGYTLSSFRVSAVTEGAWGDDVLKGRYVRDGEATPLTVNALPGTLSFDIRFTLVVDGGEVAYEKTSVILTDGASLVLTGM